MAIETVLITLGSMFAMVAVFYLVYKVIGFFREDTE